MLPFAMGAQVVIDRRILFLMWAAALASCRQHVPNLDNLSCDGATCLSGYTCDPVSALCVAQPVVGCSTQAQICPTTTQTGGDCALAGFQLPCSTAVSNCAAGGCRTCQNDHTWSSCASLATTSAGGGSSAGGSSGAGSTGGTQPGAILSVVSGSGQSFGVGARAFAIGQPVVGRVKDASSQITFGFAATVQP